MWDNRKELIFFSFFLFFNIKEKIEVSLEKIITTLQSLGLTNAEAEIYLRIARNGSQTVVELDMALSYSKNQIYRSLRTLTAKKLVNKTEAAYYALPFEEALELLIQREKEKAESMNELKKELLIN
jgi:sugar-specific transcriptional regulator TrmB